MESPPIPRHSFAVAVDLLIAEFFLVEKVISLDSGQFFIVLR
ncbi:hypothetical protein ACFQ5M_13620 [Agrilactobacillus yilanensis]|uniref:Uncharacterized protein n=1 Tax=Agrilactobacillus yilanensis TaxID=2485997 RepID=A0ABW4JAW3_9LACO|nr:hypothetical protein [Agrilactobacillus yilanensis]